MVLVRVEVRVREWGSVMQPHLHQQVLESLHRKQVRESLKIGFILLG
jgi:hypothetical protein